MNKATRMVRRSSIKLKSLSGGHSDLLMIISQLQEVKDTFKAFVKAQAMLADDLLKWSSSGLEANAIHKTFIHYSELSQLWTEVQKEFSESIKVSKAEFEQILQGEQHVDLARENLKSRDEALEKCEKELSKNKDSTAKTHILQAKLKRCEKASDLARSELAEQIQEKEAIKLIRLKKGLKRFGTAYIDMSHKCISIYKAHCMITQELPDVEGKQIQDLIYRETSCEGYVSDARNQICLYNCNATSAISPPYSPTDNANNLSVDISNVSLNNSNSNNLPEASHNETFPYPSAPPQSILYSSLGSVSPSSPVQPIYPSIPLENYTRHQSLEQGETESCISPIVSNPIHNDRSSLGGEDSPPPPSGVFFKRINLANLRKSPPEGIPMPYSRNRAKQSKKIRQATSGGISSEASSHSHTFHRNISSKGSPSSAFKPLKPKLRQSKENPPPYNLFDYANL